MLSHHLHSMMYHPFLSYGIAVSQEQNLLMQSPLQRGEFPPEVGYKWWWIKSTSFPAKKDRNISNSAKLTFFENPRCW